jgi:hypothetical protein
MKTDHPNISNPTSPTAEQKPTSQATERQQEAVKLEEEPPLFLGVVAGIPVKEVHPGYPNRAGLRLARHNIRLHKRLFIGQVDNSISRSLLVNKSGVVDVGGPADVGTLSDSRVSHGSSHFSQG